MRAWTWDVLTPCGFAAAPRAIECICAYIWEAYTLCPDRSTAFGCCAGIYEGPAQRRLWVERTPSRESGFVRRRLSVIAGTELDVAQFVIRLDRLHFITGRN